jgi:KDO2-lipid IV(A) lauroyltransferase
MMARIRHGIEYLFVLFFLGLVRLTPVRLVPILSRCAGRLAYILTPKRVNIALANLRSIYGSRSESELRQIVKGLYRNLAGNAFAVGKPVQMARSVYVSDEAEEKLSKIAAYLASGKPLILVTGHYGCWETLGPFLSQRIVNLFFLAKQQHNIPVDRLLNRLRTNVGGTIIPSHQAPRKLSGLFASGGNCILFVVDQDGGPDGVVVDFLGRPSSYARGPALYSYHYNVPVLPLFLKRNNPGFTLDVGDLIYPNPGAEKTDEITRIVAAYSDALARRVDRYPDQWLWTHRRWKSTSPNS